MKKFLFVFIIILTMLFLTSCSSSKETINGGSEDILQAIIEIDMLSLVSNDTITGEEETANEEVPII